MIPTKSVATLPNPVYLVGLGMRRKFLLVAEFDVYLVGLGLSTDSLKKAKEWANTPADSRKPLSSYILNDEPIVPKTLVPKTVKAAVMIQMVRGATKSQFVEAFREAFAGVSDEHFHTFQPLLEECMGDKGMQAKDEMVFYFMNDGSLTLMKNGVVKGSLAIRDINLRLLDIYSDPKRAVSKDLIASIDQNFTKVANAYASSL